MNRNIFLRCSCNQGISFEFYFLLGSLSKWFMFIKVISHRVNFFLKWCINVVILKFYSVRSAYRGSSFEQILYDSILINHIQIYWFFLLEHLKKYGVQWETTVSDLTWLLLNCLILFLERYNWKKYYQWQSLSGK